jgi:flagellar biosynthetic protein FlhB
MANQDSQDKKLPASQKKLSKARKEGQAARSRDLGHFAAILAGGMTLVGVAPSGIGWLKSMLAASLRFDSAALAGPAIMFERTAELTHKFMWVVLPLGGLMMLVGVVCGIAAGGWVWSLTPMAPNFGKLNPLTGFVNIFSKKQLMETLKASLLALLLGAIGAFYLRKHMDVFGGALAMPLPAALSAAGDTIVGGLVLLLVLLGVFALVDVPLKRFVFLNDQKMSHQEQKQEHKEAEGNSQIKGKMRQRMREMSRKRMLAAVPKADLVVMNPTHYAVALAYDDKKMAAPRVVAKGADLLALKIRDLAKDSKVPVLQSPMLARALYAHAKLDGEVPAALFSAVAQVLAYVYQLRAAMAGKGAMPRDLPELSVPVELDPHHTAGGGTGTGPGSDFVEDDL